MTEARVKDSQMLVVVGTLIEAAADREPAVREAVIRSLRRIAKKQPSFVLKNAAAYRMRNPKLPGNHLIALLQTMEQICKEHLPEIDGDVVLQLIEFSVEEMTQSTEYQPEQQLPASGILVALGQAHCNEVMGGLLKQFQPGVLPHYTILHTMGTLASANVFGIVPFIKATLGTMLPMMGMLRNDAMKQVFSYTLGKFSEAVSDYLANIDHAPDPTVKKEAFSSEISIAYDVLANTWIHTREPKVCETVLQAIGPMFSLLPPEKVSEQVPRLIPVLLGLYRRNMDPYPVTQCLSAVLHVALAHNRSTVEPLLDNLQNIMFDLVCTSPDYAQPATAKNHYEVLRCFDCIAGHFLDKVIELLIQQLKNNNDRERIKALFVVTHLVNSSENLIRSRISNLVTALRSMLGEHNVKVKKVLLKAIVAFAYRGYLDGTEGKEFVEFIVKHCCPQPTSVMGKDLNNGTLLEELQGTCANTLYLLATTVPQVENTLWPILLHCLLTSQYTPACSHIARCLAHLATKRKDQLNFTENSAKLAQEVTGPHVVLGRCLALLGCPLKSGRGAYILQFLRNYALNISRHLKPLWEQKIPELISHLENCKGNWDVRIWEDLVLEFLSATLTEMDEEKWTVGLGVKLMEQAPLYQNYPEERGMLYKCLAVTVCHTTDAQFINHQLDVMLSSMRQHSTSESKACARAIGICTRNHLELVLLKLEKLGKEELTRKSSRLLSFMKDVKHEGEIERARLTLLMCYGEVALEAPGTQLLPQLEQSIAQWVLHQLQTAKDAAVREASLRTLGNIAEALHPNRNTLRVVLNSRGEILNQTLSQLRPQYSNIGLNSRRLDLYPTVLRVAIALIKLPPSLTTEERISVLKTCFDKVYSAAAAVAGDSSPDEPAGDVNSCMDVGWADHMSLILSCLGSLVQGLLLDSVSPATLDEIFTLLEPWLMKKNSYQRAAAISTLRSILQCYLDNINFGYEAPTKFSQSGLILGRVVPRCTDPSMSVRQEAIDCVRLVLCLAARYEGHMADHDNDHANDLSRVREKVQTEDPNELFKVTNELAKIICAKLPHFQLIHFCESLLDGLLDAEPCSSSGASVVLNVLLKCKGGELYHQVNDILSNILDRLMSIQCVQTRTGSVRAILALAHHHPKAVVMGLLHQPLPYDKSVVECWALLAQDPVLSCDIIEQFLQLTNNTALYDEQPDRDKLRIAALQPLAAISAMHEMFRLATMQDIAVKRFPELFSLFLISLGCYVGSSPPINTPQAKRDKSTFIPNRSAYKLIPARIAVEAFKSFLLCAKCEQVAEALLQCIHMEAGDSLTSFIEMVPALTKALCARMPQCMPRLVTCLNQYATSTLEPQRIVVAAFYAELVSLNANGQVVLLESIVSNLLNCLNDPSPLVRQLCLKGLASVSHLAQEQNRHCQPVLSALIQGLDDHDNSNNIPLEAMKGFSRMLQVVDVEHVQGIQVSVALRIKPYFENENANVREAAFRMFGDLAKYGGTDSKAAFQEQVSGNLVSLLLHLDDNNKTVVKTCKYALRQASPLLGAERINTMMQDHLIDAGNLHYPDFMADLVKIMVEELPDLIPALVMNALVYIKSSWPVIRGNAAMFIGHLYGSLSDSEVANKIPLDTVCARLIQLLQDDDPGVRAKAAKALSCLVTV
ncbi:maestro heat-like repeat-containing protein family member 1 isoform X2 [Periplaneta americana]|uniref:maestro heat-like repeat-containing protein family member 1 isoform X2 n=1 Tax=Periplaneta americana TaxID=6978 RepID=UPI0037E89884